MMMRGIIIGGTYKHFKGHIVNVIGVAEHTETGELVVVYKHQGDHKLWARPMDMFLGEVDHEKYPDVQQEYRFELMNVN